MSDTSNTGAATGGPSFTDVFQRIVDNIATVIRGKNDAVQRALLCLVSEGHLLVEDVPGVGKTSLAKSLAASIDCSFGRVQFTPDVLPTDVIGVNIWDEHTRSFEFRAGPVFNNIVLGDEINRASPKTQAALLEAMEERQVTVDRTTHQLARPFMVFATQNPIEHEGTYPLPESQLDRFLMRITMGYPDRASSLDILDTHDGTNQPVVGPVATVREIAAMVEAVKGVHVAASLKEYIVSIAENSRSHHALALGVSPRATLNLQRVSQAAAASAGRGYVVPDDVKAIAVQVLAHRLALTPDAQLQGISVEDVIADVLASVPSPTAAER